LEATTPAFCSARTKCRARRGSVVPISVVGTSRMGRTQANLASMKPRLSAPSETRSVLFTSASQPSGCTRKGTRMAQRPTPSSAIA
jgi:hypothetical protein